ncbi:MAG: cytochrome c biogenesis protein DipZ, partial [Actinobacteria bacterium]|nr:cytochrome c biogenesis protein DipZ [Actinomycetota bacterium]
NEFWPAKYLIDAEGHLRYFHFGEGDYDETEDAIRSLLDEAGKQPDRDDGERGVTAETASGGALTPESYLGFARAAAFTNGSIDPGTHDYGSASGELPDDHLRFAGRWRVESDSATAVRDARLDLRFNARRVFLVLGSRGAKRVRVRLDGRPVSTADSGDDTRDSVVTVRGQRLYRLIDMPKVGKHTLTVLPDRDVSAYAFTFG